jgi:hypothetical protein
MGLALIRNCVLTLCAMIALVFVGPTAAQSQVKLYYQCQYGPGPGEEEHHREPQYDNQGRIYNYLIFCVEADRPQQQQQEYQRPAPPPPTPKNYTDAYYSVVTHADAVKVWASARRFTLADAEKDSMVYCTKMMGAGCRIATSGANNTVYVYKLPDGRLMITGDGAWSADKDRILKNCAQSISCVKVDTINSPQIATEIGAAIPDQGYYVIPENNAALYNVFGAIAWTGPGTPLSNKIWTSGGHKTRRAAEDAAWDLCSKAQKSVDTMCRSVISGGNGMLIVWADKQKNIQFDADFPAADTITPKLNWEYFSNICKKKKPKCTLKHVIDVRQTGSYEKVVG